MCTKVVFLLFFTLNAARKCSRRLQNDSFYSQFKIESKNCFIAQFLLLPYWDFYAVRYVDENSGEKKVYWSNVPV